MNCDELCLNDINLDNIPRCPNCNLISLMKLNYKEGKPIINYCCENNHKGDISLEEYLQKFKANSLLNKIVENAKKSKMKLKEIFTSALNVINFCAIHAY